MGRNRIMYLCKRHDRQLIDLGWSNPDDVEAYAAIVRTFGEVYAIQE